MVIKKRTKWTGKGMSNIWSDWEVVNLTTPVWVHMAFEKPESTVVILSFKRNDGKIFQYKKVETP